MRIYVACTLACRDLARLIARELTDDGNEVVSTWHEDDDASPAVDLKLDWPGRAEIRERCLREVLSAHVVVLVNVHGDRHGSYIEAGYAIGRGLRVVVYEGGGAAQTMLAGCPQARSIDDLCAAVRR